MLCDYIKMDFLSMLVSDWCMGSGSNFTCYWIYLLTETLTNNINYCLNINTFLNKSQTREKLHTTCSDEGLTAATTRKVKSVFWVCLFGFCFVPESDSEWRTIRGKFLAINAASMSCACPRSPKGLSPAAHLADGTTDLILVRKCSRFDFLRHLLRHTSKDDQVRHRAG